MRAWRCSSTLYRGGKSASRSGRFTHGIHWIRGWVDPRAGLDAVTKTEKYLTLPGIEPRSSSPWPSHYTDWAIPAPMDLTQTGCEDVNWIHLARDRFQWRALVWAVMNFGYHKRPRIYWLTTRFSRRTVPWRWLNVPLKTVIVHHFPAPCMKDE
jgi:hypothetical protein